MFSISNALRFRTEGKMLTCGELILGYIKFDNYIIISGYLIFDVIKLKCQIRVKCFNYTNRDIFTVIEYDEFVIKFSCCEDISFEFWSIDIGRNN